MCDPEFNPQYCINLGLSAHAYCPRIEEVEIITIEQDFH